MHHDEQYIQGIATGLGCYYLLLCGMNWVAALWLWRKGEERKGHGLSLLPAGEGAPKGRMRGISKLCNK